MRRTRRPPITKGVIHRPCDKVRHETQRQAIASAIRSSRRAGQGLRVYRCPRCWGWHLTSKQKRPSRG